MHEVLNRNLFFVKEQVGMFKAANNFDIYDPKSGDLILQCREPNLGLFTKLFRFTDFKRMTPFHIEVSTPQGEPVLSVYRGFSLLLSKVVVCDEEGRELGYFKQKLFSIGGSFDVLNMRDELVCTLKGKWTGWDFRFERDDVELAHVSKEWAGLGKELFTSADNYMLSISEQVKPDDRTRVLVMAAVMCIDMVLKE